MTLPPRRHFYGGQFEPAVLVRSLSAVLRGAIAKKVLKLVSRVCSDSAIRLSDRVAQAAETSTDKTNNLSQRVVNKIQTTCLRLILSFGHGLKVAYGNYSNIK